ncbi:MAG: hypothetical protein WD825_13950 [Gemmatimonadaceae bacterium]
MRTLAQLLSLERSLRGVRVLSVYLDGTATDPAAQRTWRVQLDHSLRDLRQWLAGSTHAERQEFERCVALLDGELKAFTRGVGAPGWAAFITPNGVRDTTLLPGPVPTLAVWSTGMCMAPYMRALKESRPLAMVVVDATKADVYRYHLGALEHVDCIRAHHVVMTPSHMGDASRPGFHAGTRGATGRDEAQRSLREGTHRMLAQATERALRVAGAEGWIVTGGIPRISGRLAGRLSARAPGRVLALDALDVHASEAQLVEAARASASTLRNELDAKHVSEIADHGVATGLGALGPAATRQALQESRVRELYLTHRYIAEHAADAEDAVRAALDQGASVEEVSGSAAKYLDLHGGMASRLRYRLDHTTLAG